MLFKLYLEALEHFIQGVPKKCPSSLLLQLATGAFFLDTLYMANKSVTFYSSETIFSETVQWVVSRCRQQRETVSTFQGSNWEIDYKYDHIGEGDITVERKIRGLQNIIHFNDAMYLWLVHYIKSFLVKCQTGAENESNCNGKR